MKPKIFVALKQVNGKMEASVIGTASVDVVMLVWNQPAPSIVVSENCDVLEKDSFREHVFDELSEVLENKRFALLDESQRVIAVNKLSEVLAK